MYMNLTIQENPTAPWTQLHIDTIRKNNQAYGMSEAFLDERSRNVAKGIVEYRSGPTHRVFEIRDLDAGGAHVGDITLIDWDPHELDVMIFDQYQGGRYAPNALMKFLADYREELPRPLAATVRGTNPNLEKVRGILRRCGFVEMEAALDVNEADGTMSCLHVFEYDFDTRS